MFHLGIWGRLFVIGIGCSSVIIALILVVCFVHPSCWGFRYLEKASKKKNAVDEVNLRGAISKKPAVPKVGQRYWLGNADCIVFQTGRDEAKEEESGNRDINLKCAPFSVLPVAAGKENSRPKLVLNLSYKGLSSDTMGRLTVHIVEVKELPYREYFPSLEPYIVLEVLNIKWTLHKSDRLAHSVHSRVVRHSYNPKFDQTFVFDVKKSEVKDWCLKFTVFDKDRLTRKTPICERRIFIRDVKALTSEPEIKLETDLVTVSRTSGELLFGISYLPTSRRLSFTIMKATSLKFQNVVESIEEFYPYVRVLMLNSQGKCVKKKKTCFRHAEENPIFNETLAFELSVSNLECAVFLLLLCSKLMGKRSGSDGSIADTLNVSDINQQSPAKENVLGIIAIGKNVRSSKGRDHWVMVMQNPRKIISVWHSIR